MCKTRTYIPDLFNGDPLTEANIADPTFNREEWREEHGPKTVRAPLNAAIKGLKELGITDFGATSYCKPQFTISV